MSSISRLAIPWLAFGALLGAQNAPRTRNPHGPLPVSCEACHTSVAWTPIRPHPEFDHHSQTAYPLRGMHENVACRSCHVRPVFRNTAKNCASCHADFHRGQMGRNCEQCHTVRGWQTAVQQTREHSNRFPLLGGHAVAPCESCHRGAATGVFAGLSTECVVCHRSDFASAQSPPHQSAGFPLDCAVCHTFNAWRGAKFDHAAVAKFPLDGAHRTLPCESCHLGGRFAGTPAACVSCHLDAFNSTTSPSHVAANFPRDCSVCHNTTTWLGAKFDHGAQTGFALTGAHAPLACSQCHTGNNFSSASKACVGCHLADFNKTTNPNHVQAGFPTDCSVCHNTAQWAGAKFDHGAISGFPLTGAHAPLQCTQCHAGGNFASAPRTCDGCHMADYNKTSNPNHTQAGFPTDCSICHSTTSWAGAVFDHSRTKFPLTGAHISLQCQQCHTTGNFAAAPATCDGCHLTDYNKTTNPNHAQAGFPTDCSVCHGTTSWAGAVFDHSKTKFPLTGAHVNVQCTACHIGGRFAGTPADCYSCHQNEFNSVQNPNHRAANFPTDCTVCHNTTTWQGATFAHTKFPIYSGTHNGKWTTCADCHRDPSNYNTFSCTDCHTHSQAATDPRHRNVRGYVYSPTSCYQCHPQGRE